MGLFKPKKGTLTSGTYPRISFCLSTPPPDYPLHCIDCLLSDIHIFTREKCRLVEINLYCDKVPIYTTVFFLILKSRVYSRKTKQNIMTNNHKQTRKNQQKGRFELWIFNLFLFYYYTLLLLTCISIKMELKINNR